MWNDGRNDKMPRELLPLLRNGKIRILWTKGEKKRKTDERREKKKERNDKVVKRI